MLSWKHWLLISVSLDKEYTTPLCQVRDLPLKYLKFLVSIIIVYVCMHAMIRFGGQRTTLWSSPSPFTWVLEGNRSSGLYCWSVSAITQ